MIHKMDLHTHSCMSDGTERPADVVRQAADAGVAMLALSDHDCVEGLQEAEAACPDNLIFLPSVELDTEHSEELHILGLDLDYTNPDLLEVLKASKERRNVRNAEIIGKLCDAGYDIRKQIEDSERKDGVLTKAHIALALCNAGFADGIHDAFARYLKPGMPGYVHSKTIQPRDAIEVIRKAGGVPVLAHPCHLKKDPAGVIAMLHEYGLEGVEAYYRTSTPGQTKEFCSIAHRLGLRITTGSDFHGKTRPDAKLGCAWHEVPELEETFRFFENRGK